MLAPVAAMYHAPSEGPSFRRIASTVPMHASQSVCLSREQSSIPRQQREPARQFTRALFWTESYYDSTESRWVGRVRMAEAHQTKSP